MTRRDRCQAIEKASSSTFQLFTRARREGEGRARVDGQGEPWMKSTEELNWYIYQSLAVPPRSPRLTTLQAAPGEVRP